MADFMNEQEQVDMIKGWWKKHGNRLLTIVLIVVVGVSGYRYWTSHQKTEVANNGNMYMSLVLSANKKDAINVDAKASALMKNSPKSVYAGLAALTLAGFDVNQGKLDSAKTNFNWILKHQSNSDIKAIAKMRLARIDLAQGKPAEALKLLTPVAPNFAASAQMIRGDAYAAQKNYRQAKASYKLAAKLSTKLPIQSIVQLKLHNLPEVS